MGTSAVALTWAAGLVVGFLVATVLFLRRRVMYLHRRMVKLETILENQDARLFMLEQEQRWLAARSKEISELQS